MYGSLFYEPLVGGLYHDLPRLSWPPVDHLLTRGFLFKGSDFCDSPKHVTSCKPFVPSPPAAVSKLLLKLR